MKKEINQLTTEGVSLTSCFDESLLNVTKEHEEIAHSSNLRDKKGTFTAYKLHRLVLQATLFLALSEM